MSKKTMAIGDTGSDGVLAQPATAPEAIYVYAPENIGSIKLIGQADDADEEHITRQGMYAKLLKL